MSGQSSIYPCVYGYTNEPEVKPIGRVKLNLSLDNIDELANKWLVDKTYAIIENISWLLQRASVVIASGLTGLSIHYFGRAINTIKHRGGLLPRTLVYYSEAHNYCYENHVLGYYDINDVKWVFNTVAKLINK